MWLISGIFLKCFLLSRITGKVPRLRTKEHCEFSSRGPGLLTGLTAFPVLTQATCRSGVDEYTLFLFFLGHVCVGLEEGALSPPKAKGKGRLPKKATYSV